MTLSEQSRRMQEMMKMYGMDSMGMDMGGENTLILNANHPLVQLSLIHISVQAEAAQQNKQAA